MEPLLLDQIPKKTPKYPSSELIPSNYGGRGGAATRQPNTQTSPSPTDPTLQTPHSKIPLEKPPRSSFLPLLQKSMDTSRHCICQQQGPAWHHPLRAGTTTCSSTTGPALLPPKFRLQTEGSSQTHPGKGDSWNLGPKGHFSVCLPSPCSWGCSSSSQHCRQLL